jgi:hypothetical protein
LRDVAVLQIKNSVQLLVALGYCSFQKAAHSTGSKCATRCVGCWLKCAISTGFAQCIPPKALQNLRLLYWTVAVKFYRYVGTMLMRSSRARYVKFSPVR